MGRLNTMLITTFRVVVLSALGLIINALVHIQTHSASYPKPPSQVTTPNIPQGRNGFTDSDVVKLIEKELSLDNNIYTTPKGTQTPKHPKKRLTIEEIMYIKCPSDGDFGDEVWKHLECKKRLPSILGIGFQRCGMTALNLFLSTHPNIRHAIPYQVAFWNRNWDRGIEWYLEQMPISSKYQETMETTSTYIFSEDVPKMISYVKPEMKFIVLVCDPIDRAMSDFAHLSGTGYHGYVDHFAKRPKDGSIKPYVADTFEESVLDIHSGDPLKSNSLIVHGQYVLYLRQWLRYFPKENFLILDGTSFRVHPLPVLRQVEDFLEISSYFDDDKLYYDTYKGFFCRAKPSHMCTAKNVGRHHPPIDDEVSRKLKTFYREHNKGLELLTGKKFTWT